MTDRHNERTMTKIRTSQKYPRVTREEGKSKEVEGSNGM